MQLGELEKQVLHYLWNAAESDAKQVHAVLGQSRGNSLNTIQSTLDRLFKKGLLGRTKQGHAYYYSAKVDREALIAKLITNVTSDFVADGEHSLIAAFSSASANLNDAQLDQLQTLIEAQRKLQRGLSIMLVGDLAIALNLLSIAVLAFAISVVLLCISFRAILNRLAHFTFGLRKAILWAWVSAPWWIAAGCVAVLWPSLSDIFAATWLSGLAHWHHVDLFSFTSWHAITLFSAAAYATWSIARNVFYRRKQASAMTALLSLSDIKPETTTEQSRYYSLALSIPTAFTAGLIRPRIYVTTALQQQVNPQQLDIIVRHEMAHVAARDPLFKTVFAALACFYPAGIARGLITQFTLLTEQIADHAATDAYDNLDVAQTLIDVARLQRNLNFGNKSPHCDGVASYFGNDQTSVRVQCLINPALSTSRSAIVLALLLFSCSPLLVASTVDSLHHFIETFITH